MENTRPNIVNFLYMTLHWLIADAAILLGFLFQLSFPKDPHPETEATIYFNKIYHVNIPLYILGTVIILVGYFIVWKLWLREDWLKFKGAKAGWTVAGILLEIVNMVLLFVLYFLVMVGALKWGNYADGSEWVNYAILVVLAIVLVMPLWFFRKKSKK